MMHPKWRTLALAAALVAAAPLPARAQHTAPRDTGLIVGSLEAAIRQPAERLDEFSLTVDLSDRKLYVMSGDEVVRTFPVSVGSEGYSTPAGSFRIRRMIWNPSWVPPKSAWARDKRPESPGSPGNPMGRVKMFFREPDYYIHGTGLVSSLGNARSHGCIRMRNIDAVHLARIVMINGGGTRNHDWYAETLEKSTTSREVALPRPVPVRVRQ
ncbi:MAG TPA: L,D-transpeptidase [Longimicrobium sp.]|nr:L,D-transpeptidase [Longimicrobium sp.]